MAGPFKLRSQGSSFKMMGSSPAKHPHDTWEEASSHPRNQPHPKEQEMTASTVVDNMGNIVEQEAKLDELKGEREIEPKEVYPQPETKLETLYPKGYRPPSEKFIEDVSQQREELDADAEAETRSTSWWKGEEGWIPDELQPHVDRPDVELTEKEKLSRKKQVEFDLLQKEQSRKEKEFFKNIFR